MKKISLAIIASFALCAISCDNNLEPVSPAENNENNLIQMTFKATTNTTKTEIGALSGSQYPVIWSDSDKIKVIAVDASGEVLSETVFDIVAGGSSTASFTGTTDGTAAAYYAIYPSTYTTTVSGTESSATVALTDYKSHDVVAVQDGFDSSRAVMFAVADSEASFAFMHGVSFFKITVAPSDVSEIEFRVPSSDGGARIFGNPTYKFSDGSTSAYNGADKNNNYVTLKPSSGTLVQGGTYYVPFAAKNSSLSTYLQITYTFSNNATVSKKTTKLNGKFDNGTVYDLGTPPINFSTDPVLTIKTATLDNVTAAATSGLTASGAYSVMNCNDSDVTVSFDGTVVTAASISEGTVTYSVSENTGDARQGWIGLQLAGGEVQKITVNQVAAGIATELVPITATTTWSADNWTALKTSKGTDAISESFIDSNMKFVCGGKIKFGTSNSTPHCQLGGAGSSSTVCLQFQANGNGTVSISAAASGDNSDRSIVISNGSNVQGSIATPYKSTVSSGSIDVTANSGDVISIYSLKSTINIYEVTWTPSN